MPGSWTVGAQRHHGDDSRVRLRPDTFDPGTWPVRSSDPLVSTTSATGPLPSDHCGLGAPDCLIQPADQIPGRIQEAYSPVTLTGLGPPLPVTPFPS